MFYILLQSQVETDEQDLDNKWKAYYDKFSRNTNQPQLPMSSTPMSKNDVSNSIYLTPERPTPSPLVISPSLIDSALCMTNSNSMSDVTSPTSKPMTPIQSSSSLPSSKSVSDFERRIPAPGHLMGIVNQQHSGSDLPKQQIPNIGGSNNKKAKEKERRGSVSPAAPSRLLPSGQQQIFPKQLAQSTGKKGKKK